MEGAEVKYKFTGVVGGVQGEKFSCRVEFGGNRGGGYAGELPEAFKDGERIERFQGKAELRRGERGGLRGFRS